METYAMGEGVHIQLYEVMGTGVWVASATLLTQILCAAKATTSISNQSHSHNHTSLEGSSQMNIWPAAQTSPGPLGGAWIGWECRKDVVGLWWKCGSSPIQMYVTVGRDRLCLILWHVVMPPIARGQTWLFQPLPVSTVPNTGRNQFDSGYRGLDEKD